MTITIPIKTVSESNARCHWTTRNRRKKQQQHAVALYMMEQRNKVEKIKPPYHVTLTRIGKKRCDVDNCVSSFKHVQDQVARSLGIDDGSDQVEWKYEQDVRPREPYGVVVEIVGANN